MQGIQRIELSNNYKKSFRKLHPKVQEEALKKIRIFQVNPFHPTLRTHKLSGKEKEHWAFWINYSYRVKFLFLGDEEVLFLDIGTHDIYK